MTAAFNIKLPDPPPPARPDDPCQDLHQMVVLFNDKATRAKALELAEENQRKARR